MYTLSALARTVRRTGSIPGAKMAVAAARRVNLIHSAALIGTSADGLSFPPNNSRPSLCAPPLSWLPSYQKDLTTFCDAPSVSTRLPWCGFSSLASPDDRIVQHPCSWVRARFLSSQPTKEESSADDNITEDDAGGEIPTETEKLNNSTPSWHDQNFAEMIEELRAYREKFRSCNVPNVYPPNPTLGMWVYHQRQNLRKFQQGKKTPLTKDQVMQLNDLDLIYSHEKRWMFMFDALRTFQQTHGHCNVPSYFPDNYNRGRLGRWVNAQRTQYNRGALSSKPERVRLLEELGFEWELKVRPGRLPWWDMYELLREHWEQHNDFKIPADDSKGKQLATWVARQRNRYKQHQEGKHSGLEPDQVQALENIDFVCDLNEVRWMDRFLELHRFRQQHGHCTVPKQNAGPGGVLYRWTRQQRRNRRLGEAGMKEPMPEEKIKLLDGEGFVWDPPQEAWNTNFDKLVEFHRVHGHFNVSFESDKKLHRWVYNQREVYRKFREGKKTPMTLERLIRMENIGFQWSLDKHPIEEADVN